MNKEHFHKHTTLNGQLSFDEISPGFPVIKINNEYACATISLYGGQLLDYKPHEQLEQVIWLSDQALFEENKAIRGGVPICWPWFGDYEKFPAHGYARTTFWEIESTKQTIDGGTEVILKMSCHELCQNFLDSHPLFDCDLAITITVASKLTIELKTTNNSQHTVGISDALHSYFKISDIHTVDVIGLAQVNFFDKLKNQEACYEESKMRFMTETDRVFIDTTNEINLNDPGFNRTITISKKNSNSTVIWNPWQEKSSQMSDMSNQAWLQMLCIESANVLKNQLLLESGETHRLTTSIAVKTYI
ncbi:MAG: D-hexose-6-phosphate mutarotase [Gammaproteobacteria bacterium]|nr:D-hexose-6-phosphate mutarotase [Gammaproteobacteria bacterium]